MQQQKLPPIFIRANLTFPVGGKEFSFINHGISIAGVSGLRWSYFDPTSLIGTQTNAKVDIICKNRFQFHTPALIGMETTGSAYYIGLKFQLADADRKKLNATIHQEGYYPTEYMRKYPRIPAFPSIQHMPLRTIIKPPNTNEVMVFDVANLSPSGVLLQTENPKASIYTPGMRISAQVEPRGDGFKPFAFDGMICRVNTEKNALTSNTVRQLGVRFLKIPAEHQNEFLAILKSVLESIQN